MEAWLDCTLFDRHAGNSEQWGHFDFPEMNKNEGNWVLRVAVAIMHDLSRRDITVRSPFRDVLMFVWPWLILLSCALLANDAIKCRCAEPSH
jgi:hypothetical protein